MTLSAVEHRWRRIARRGRAGLRREWRHGRLDLRELPNGTRRLAKIMLALIGASAAIVVARGLNIAVPGPTIGIPSQFLAADNIAVVPVVALLIACAGMSLSAAGLALANEQSGRRLSQLVLVAIGALGLAMSSQLVGAGGDLAGIEALATGPIRSPDASQVVVAGGWIGIGCALVAICLAVARPRGLGLWFVPAVATVPFALIGVLVAAVGYESFDLGNAGQSAGLPQVLTASSYVAPALLTAAKVVGFWLIPLALWQVVTWARASKREVGGALAARDAAWPWLLAALLTFKLGWLLLGYAGRLPTLLGGDAPTWKTVLDDGIPAWLLAALFASLAGWWLVSPRRIQVSERGFTPAALLVVLGFSAVTVAMSLAIVALPVAGLLPGTPLTQKLASACATNWRSEAIGNATKCLLDAATDHQFELTILVDLHRPDASQVRAMLNELGADPPT